MNETWGTARANARGERSPQRRDGLERAAPTVDQRITLWNNPALMESFRLAYKGTVWHLECRCGWKETVGTADALARIVDRAMRHWIKSHKGGEN